MLLSAAGFAALYRETSLDAEPMKHVLRALDRILDQQELYPALVLDRCWNLLPAVAVTTHLRAPDGGEAKLFTMLTTLGTPLDVTAEELRIELYFPLDDACEAFLRG